MIEQISYRSGPGWHVAYCGPQQQKRAKSGIEALGHEVYMPVEKLRRRLRGKTMLVERPLFGAYLFFSLDPHRQEWSPILAVDGVEDILRNNLVPSRVPEVWITMMRKAEMYGEFDRTPDSPQPFSVGETVRIGEGPFSGMHAVMQEFMAKLKSSTATKRAKVLVEFFGRSIETEVEVCALERV